MFSDLTFDEKRHLYYWKGQRVPFSVTGLVKKFVPPFDEAKFLPLSAAKLSRETGEIVSQHELKRRWQLTNTTACDLGTKVHKFLEDYTGIEKPTCGQEIAGIQYIKDLEGEYKIAFRELRAYSKEFNFAGTMDIPLQSVRNPNEYIIDDYKTNGDLFKAYDLMYPPFGNLESSAYNAYQLQLSYYQIMLEDAGLNIVGRRLVHLKADGTYKIWPLWDYTQILRDYMRNQIKYN